MLCRSSSTCSRRGAPATPERSTPWRRVVARSDKRPDRNTIERLLPRFTGIIEQVPPRFSAVKLAGERAYDLARGGEAVELAPRTITVHRLELAEISDPDHAVLTAECGKGTYIR